MQSLFLFRGNLDIFRLNIELPILLSVWLLVRPFRVRFVQVSLGLICLLMLYYYIYEAVTVSFFLVDPIVYNQYFLARDGLQFLFQHVDLSPLMISVAVLALIGLHLIVAWLLRWLWSRHLAERIHWATRASITILALLGIASVVRYELSSANPVMVPSSISYKVEKNFEESFEIARSVQGFRGEVLTEAYDYSGYKLAEKPNIYFILVESYGSVLYKRPHFTADYLATLDQLEAYLSQHGWHAASNLSTATTWGGGSWMSYASLLFGLRIDTHPQFLYLRNRYQYVEIPDIGHFLKSQGYRYSRISPLAVEMTDHEWAQYINFYGVDNWLRFSDMDYTGDRYSWGPSPPEQYSLGFMFEGLTAATAEQPQVMFMITQNSHYPWAPLPPRIDDWRRFNDESFEGFNPADGLTGVDADRKNYLASIDYELRTIADLIRGQGDENAIFVLVGDHQPPRVSRRDDGFEVPMHIISRDPLLVDALAEYHFEEGLRVRVQSNPITHEGFYSLFMRVLLSRYGEDVENLPAYLSNGIQMVDMEVE